MTIGVMKVVVLFIIRGKTRWVTWVNIPSRVKREDSGNDEKGADTSRCNESIEYFQGPSGHRLRPNAEETVCGDASVELVSGATGTAGIPEQY
jgi:hypothetical protein